MQATVTIGVPMETTAEELRALASLLRAIEAGKWYALERSFAKMGMAGAELSEPLEAMVGTLAGSLVVEARHRDPAPAAAGDG
jgi:hypothetical protein